MFNYSTFIEHCFNLLFELKEKELKSYEMHNPLSEELAIFIESKAFPIRLNKIKNVDTKSTSFSASPLLPLLPNFIIHLVSYSAG